MYFSQIKIRFEMPLPAAVAFVTTLLFLTMFRSTLADCASAICMIPDCFDEDSVTYDFFSERSDDQSQPIWTLNAIVAWDSPGEGYGFAVRLNTTTIIQTPGCERDGLDPDLYIYTESTNHTFENLQYGYEQRFKIFLTDIATQRTDWDGTTLITSTSPDCYEQTKDVEFCRSLPIETASIPVNAAASCLVFKADDNDTIQAIYFTWDAPVQIDSDRNVSEVYIHLINSLNDDQISVTVRELSEIEMIDLSRATSETAELVGFGQVLDIPTETDLPRNNTYSVRMYSNTRINGRSAGWGNEMQAKFHAMDIPECVSWSNWNVLDLKWIPDDCCDENPQSRLRDCIDPFQSGLQCDGPSFENKTCDPAECSTTILNNLQIGIIIVGSAITAACAIALILKCCFKTPPSDEEKEKYISDRYDSKTKTARHDKYDIRRTDLTVLDMLLGSGAQGSVYKGRFRVKNNKWIDVAVKTPKIRDLINSQENLKIRETFLKEVTISIEIQGRKGHPNILPVVGHCITVEPFYLVTPFMKYGDLLRFVRKCRAKEGEHEMEDPIYDLTPIDMFNIVLQIAKGMDFLSSGRIYNGDLAASNVLVGEGLEVKIADFGLAVDLYLTDAPIARQETKQFRPRWVSLETLKSNGKNFHLRSDVWSFGIVMYEVYSYGETPYNRKWGAHQILEALESGYRLEKPPACPDYMYTYMNKCWHKFPNSRPTFTALVKELDRRLTEVNARVNTGYITAIDPDAPPGVDNPSYEFIDHTEQGVYVVNPIAEHKVSGTTDDSGDEISELRTVSGVPDDGLWNALNSPQPTDNVTFTPDSDQNKRFFQSTNSEVVDMTDFYEFKRLADDDNRNLPEKEVTL